MGQGMSCGAPHDHGLFAAAQFGESNVVLSCSGINLPSSAIPLPTITSRCFTFRRQRPDEIVSMLLDRNMNTDLLNRHKQTPLMLAVMQGRLSCVEKLLEAGSNVRCSLRLFVVYEMLVFDSLHGRTCLHYATYYGYSKCLKAILSAARSSPVAASWGYARFVNIRDGKGATPLHVAARQRWPECVHILLGSGALVRLG